MPKTLDDLLDPAELRSLTERYGDFSQRHLTQEMQPSSVEHYRRWLDHRRGEALFVLQRPDGSVLLHTKLNYPDGCYRLPGGGIDWGEPAADTFLREVHEETQMAVRDEKLLGVLTYEFTGDGEPVPFVSYVFLAQDIEGTPVPLDESEQITDFRWVPTSELPAIAAQLRQLSDDEPGRSDWGNFRALGHEFLVDYFSE